jgi:hypothetical protein
MSQNMGRSGRSLLAKAGVLVARGGQLKPLCERPEAPGNPQGSDPSDLLLAMSRWSTTGAEGVNMNDRATTTGGRSWMFRLGRRSKLQRAPQRDPTLFWPIGLSSSRAGQM